jgi:ABC-type polysaccharide/polyol phosphate export permease
MATPSPAADAVTPGSRAVRPGFFGLIREGFRELRSRGHLIRYVTSADLRRTHADTVIGQLWWIIDPFLQMIIYVVLVTIIFERKVPDYPLFIFCCILPWKWFNTTLKDAATSITARNTLIRQVQFPKIVLPAASVAAGTVSFLFGLVSLGLLLLYYHHHISHWLLTFPIIAAVQLVFTFALALFVSAANAFYRDVQNVLTHALRLWFYLSPALYSVAMISSPGLQDILRLNPFTPIFESYRNVVYNHAPPDWGGLAVVLALSLVLTLLGTFAFKRVEPGFAKIL